MERIPILESPAMEVRPIICVLLARGQPFGQYAHRRMHAQLGHPLTVLPAERLHYFMPHHVHYIYIYIYKYILRITYVKEIHIREYEILASIKSSVHKEHVVHLTVAGIIPRRGPGAHCFFGIPLRSVEMIDPEIIESLRCTQCLRELSSSPEHYKIPVFVCQRCPKSPFWVRLRVLVPVRQFGPVPFLWKLFSYIYIYIYIYSYFEWRTKSHPCAHLQPPHRDRFDHLRQA